MPLLIDMDCCRFQTTIKTKSGRKEDTRVKISDDIKTKKRKKVSKSGGEREREKKLFLELQM